MTTDLIDKFCKICRRYTDTPDVFLKAGAYYVLSTVFGAFFVLKDTKVRRLNTWFTMSSIPGRMRRSTILNYTDKVIYEATLQYNVKKGLDRDEAIKKYRLSQIEDGSPEGIADDIIEGYKNNVNCFNIASSEFGNSLKKLSGKSGDYRGGADSLFSKMYYGERYNQSLSHRGGGKKRYIPEGTYVTMFCSIQEPHLYLSSDMNRQGLLRRIKWVFVKPEDMNMVGWKSPFMDGYDQIYTELRNFVTNDIVPRMIRYDNLRRKQGEIGCTLSDDVKKIIEKKSRVIDAALIDDPDNRDYHIFRQTGWEYEVKLTILNAISNDKTFEADMIDYKRAVDFLNVVDKHEKDMIEGLARTNKMDETDRILTRLKRKINNAGPEGILWSKMVKDMFGLTSDEIRPYLATLVSSKQVYLVEPDLTQMVRPGPKGERYANIVYKP